MLTIRQFMAACALAHGHDCTKQGWEYCCDDDLWYDDLIGLTASDDVCTVWMQSPDGTTRRAVLDRAAVDHAAELVGYLDMF